MQKLQLLRNKLIEPFKKLQFNEEKHIYTVDGKEYTPVSTMIENFYEPFDSYNIGRKYAEKHVFDVEDVWSAWEGEGSIASGRGTEVHNFGEAHAKWKYWGEGIKPKVGSKQELGIVQFYNDLPKHIVPVGLETRMYSEEHGFAGTADIVLYNGVTEEFYIFDFKTNNSLSSSYDKKPLKHIPLERHLLQDNFGKYTLQIGGFYRILLEDVGFNVTHHCIIWLQEGQDKKLYQKVYTQDVSGDIRKYLK